jgi:hypothetical protein
MMLWMTARETLKSTLPQHAAIAAQAAMLAMRASS